MFLLMGPCQTEGQVDQRRIIDSLTLVVQSEVDIITRLKAQSSIVRRYTYLDYVKSLEAVGLAEALLQQTDDINARLSASVSIAQAYYVNGQIEKTRSALRKVLPQFTEAENHRDKIFAHFLMGFSYQEEDVTTCLTHFEDALVIAHAASDTALMGATNSNIGTIYMDRGLSEDAKKYFLEAVQFLRESGRPVHLAAAVANLALLEEDENKVLAYTKEARAIYMDLGYLQRALDVNVTLGQRFFTDNNYELARKYYSDYVQAYSGVEKPEKYYSTLIPLGISYFELGQVDSAYMVLVQAEKYYSANPDIPMPDAIHFHEGIMKVYAAKNNFEGAYYHAWRRNELFDSLEYSKNAEFTSEFNVKYETEKKERQIAEQELQLALEKNRRNRQLLVGLSILSLFTLLGLLYFSRLRRKKREVQHDLQLRELETASLKALDETKSRWFENISHDIRTPLTLISAPIKDLLKISTSSPAKQLLDIADRNSQHLLQLTNEMLELSRLENSAIPIRKSSRTAYAELQKMINAFDSFAKDNQVSLDYTIDLDAQKTLALDYDKYEKVFNNILKNAIHYSPSGSTVHIHVWLDENDVLNTAISDEGAGISAERIPHLFDKYYRAEGQEIEGSGLGLAIVKELVDLLDGNIEVTSGEGEGSTFHVGIPADVKTQTPGIIAEAVDEHVEHKMDDLFLDAGQHTILLVEDNIEMRRYLTQVLSVEYKVEAAENGFAALQKLENETFDLIVSDIMMPGMDGLTLKKRVNSRRAQMHIPFVFLSAKALESDKIRGLRLGVDDYITKPFITDELKARIRNILRRKAIREATQKEAGESIDESSVSDLPEVVDQARSVIMDKINDTNFGVEHLAEHMHYSSRQLNRILKRETGMTSVQFILEVRLLQARKLLLSREYYSVKEVQHQIGIHSPSYFSRKYAERFGHAPNLYFT